MEQLRKRALLECRLYKSAAEIAEKLIREAGTEQDIMMYLFRLRSYMELIDGLQDNPQPPAA